MKRKAVQRYEKGEISGDELKEIKKKIELKLIRQEAILEATKKRGS